MTLFLRSDIYSAIIQYARERDKLPIRRINWHDPELLRRVIEERFVKSGADVVRPTEIGEKYFPPVICSVPIRDYLSWAILPRPRDLIFLVKTSLEFAVDREHPRIEEADMISAQPQYSHFALNSLLTEATPRIADMDNLLLQFAGQSEIVNAERIRVAMRRTGIDETLASEVIDILTELTFLGPEIADGRYEFVYDEDALAHNLAEERGREIRYRINPAFHAFLDIQPERSIAPGQLQMNLR